PFKRGQKVITPDGVGTFEGEGLVVAGEQQYVVEFAGKATRSYVLSDIQPSAKAEKPKKKTKKKVTKTQKESGENAFIKPTERMKHDLLHQFESEVATSQAEDPSTPSWPVRV
ncbi:MAG: hypothetical protein ACXABY_20380, partial [Candidatus Thorarchaeota archaeon]